MSSNHHILCCLLFLLSSVFPASGSFPVNRLPIRWPKYWSFSICPHNEYSGLISDRIDWFNLAVQGTLKSLLQHHISKSSVLQRSAFFMVQLLHSYMTTGNAIALTIWTFISKVMSLLFNMLPRLVMAFLPKIKSLLISWLSAIRVASSAYLRNFEKVHDSQQSTPTPKFKSTSSLALSFLYSPALTSIHDYWKNHSFDYMNLCW